MFLTPKSTIYLRPDIEYQQLTQGNVIACIPGTNLANVADDPVTVTSTGNGIIYLQGTLTNSSDLSGGEIIVTIPAIYKNSIEKRVNASFQTGTLNRSIAVILNTDNEIVVQAYPFSPIATGSTISLYGIYYLQDFTG